MDGARIELGHGFILRYQGWTSLWQKCTFGLQDAVVFAQTLKKLISSRSLSSVSNDEICKALRDYEKARSLRVTKITVRSNLMGQLLSESF
jgi:2-polyprenyl-6-methoxyphenol hydroxylase-like FAD-dependent oxidoreductase